jgi:hypothetical protein
MPLRIGPLEYLTTADICDLIGISRQTLWRWRQGAHIPPGLRYRGKRLVFSSDEVEHIRRYASLLEPAGEPLRTQLVLFRPESGTTE